MSILCPYCSHRMNAKAVRPGKFSPKCSKCGRTFQLTVSMDGATPRFHTAPVPAPAIEATAVAAPSSSHEADFSVDAVPATPSQLESTEVHVSTPAAPAAADQADMPTSLGGYQILRILGRGGMGAVYLARQVSLDRPVALKVMNGQWASNTAFLVRFTREAYAAAQLVHHNVVQVYDIGEDKGQHYFSMEFVAGQSLGELLRKEGKLPADVAAGLVLQAARGLHYAHERGMIHRDVKPDNLMLNDQGLVKVADLGLVRTPGMTDEAPVPSTPSLAQLSNVTLAGQAMGTPSYMAPEQARDATKVDQRADVYSLGCTLYVLITGKPVFTGNTALEVMTKHAYDPVVRPDAVVKEVPKAIADIVIKMLAKNPDDRYPGMDEVIKALEDFMGLQGKDQQAQVEQHLRTLEQSVKEYQSAPLAQLRSWVLLGFFGGCALVVLVPVLFGAWWLAGGVLGVGLMSGLAYLVVHGVAHRTALVGKLRDLAFSAAWMDLARVFGGLVLFLLVLWLCKLLGVWFLAVILGICLAVGTHFALDRPIAKGRREALDKVESLLKTLRGRGLSEEALQEFVALNAGDGWEQYYEALFGYPAKLEARARYNVGIRAARPKYGSWRDPVIRWIDRYQQRQREARERKHLEAVERKNLEAQGVAAAEAKEKAQAVAGAMVQKAAELKQTTHVPNDPTVAPEAGVDLSRPKAPPPRRVVITDLLDVADAPPPPRRPARVGPAIEDALNTVFGSGVRFLVGVALVGVCLLWLHKNNLLPASTQLDDKEAYAGIWERMKDAQPLPFLPEALGQLFNHINPGVAGLLLLLSTVWRSWKIGFLVLAGAAVSVFGPLSEVISPGMWLGVGTAVAVLGFVIGRDT